MSRSSSGFTAVELLVAMVIGILLLGSAYQLYAAASQDAGASRQRSIASSYAYTLLRQYQKNTSLILAQCAPSSSTPTIPSSVGLSPNASATVAVTCPFGSTPGTSKLSVTITYYTPNMEQVTRAIAVQP